MYDVVNCRWERGDVSLREFHMLSDNPNPSLLLSTSGVIGGQYQSTVLLRTITLMILAQRINVLAKKRFDAIQSKNELENEAVEFDRKVSINKLHKSRESLKRLFGLDTNDEKNFIFERNSPFEVSLTTNLNG